MDEADIGLGVEDGDYNDDATFAGTSHAKDGTSNFAGSTGAHSRIDPEELNDALQGLEDTRQRSREHTPGTSPSRKRQRRIYGDRCVVNMEFIN